MKHPLAFGAVLYVALMTIAAARAQAPRPLYIDSGTTSPMTVSFTSGSNGYSEIVQAFYATSSNNVLIVSNTGTLLNARDSTYIGYNGSGGNNLTIAGGGVFNGTTAFVGYTTNTASNSVLVTGDGSSWTNSGDLNFGRYSSGNSMVVSDGGLVSAANLYMSRFAGGGNTIQVTGSGSRLVANSGFEIGEAGTGGNSVTISNGGRVENNSGYGFIGYAATASNNSVTVTGTNSRWSNSPSFGFYVGYQSSGNNLVISNGGGVNSTAAGIGDAVTSSNNSVLVTGAGSFWSNSGSMTLGNLGAGNSLVISDGARVVSSSGLSLGQFAGSTNNSVLVTGLGSSFSSTNSLLIGPRGGGVFTVADGGSMAARDITIASEAGSSGVLNVGYGAAISTGTITITTGATNSTGTLNFIDSVGSISEATFGASTVTFGIGTATINMNQGNAVTIASTINGGGTLNQLGPGQTFLSGNSTFFTGSTVISGGSLWVTGANALGSSKVTLNGGLLALPYGVTLSNSFDWNSSGSIYLGGSSSSVSPLTMAGGTLTLTGSSLHTFSLDYTYRLSTDPAQILVGVGGNSASQFGVSGRDNYALFVSNNTLWVTLGNLYVGTNSTPATKSFTSGTLEYNNTYVGFSPTASNNTLNVSGAGTVLTNHTDLYVGYEGSSNTMQVANGGTVANTIGFIGNASTSSNNSVLVTGANSLWTNSANLYVGYGGSGNNLTIADGGTVAASNISIASQAGSSGTLNIGRFGTNDTAGTINAPTIAFGSGTGAINFNQSNAVTITSAISGNGAVNQLGTGTTILSASNTYTGGTMVSAGSLVGTTASLQGAITNNAAVTFDQSTDGTYSGAMSGSGSLSKTGIGRLSLSGSSSYNGATTVSAGDLNLSGGSITNSAVTVASGASLSGYGSVGTIGGAGAINPGNSPGILTTPQVNPSGETDFNLEMTGTAPTYNNASNSVNDVIRITGLTPFSAPLAAGNGINIYFSGDALFTGSPKTITGGFFTDQSASFAGFITNAMYNYYFANAIGTNSYNGANYYSKAQYETAVLSSNLMTITITTVARASDFGSGNVNGQVMQIDVIPEPSTYALLVLAVIGLGAQCWRRGRKVA